MSSPIRCVSPSLRREQQLRAALMFGLLACAACAALAENGLRWSADPSQALDDGATTAGWRGQLAVSVQDPGDAAAWDPSAGRPGNLSLLSGYYFSNRTLGASAGGFRATGGVIGAHGTLGLGTLGSSLLAPGFTSDRRSYSLTAPPWAGDAGDAAAVPYVGVGYTGLIGKRSLTGQGWGVSADLGMTALQPRSAVRLGQAPASLPALGDLVRDLQLNPMIHVGVSYAF